MYNADIFEETLTQVAKDHGVEREWLRHWFGHYLESGSSELSGETLSMCYAVYRITKLRMAFRLTSSSRECWRERALAAGWTPDQTEDTD